MDDPDQVSNPKEWIKAHMRLGVAYKESIDQEVLSVRINADIAHANSRSFRRLCHAVEQLIEEIESNTP